MLNGTPAPKSQVSRTALIAGLCAGGIVLGVVIAFGVFQLSAQKQQIAQMSEAMTLLAEQRSVAQATTPVPEAKVEQEAEQEVTRAATPDFLADLAAATAVVPTPPVQPVTPQSPQSAAALVKLAAAAGNTATQALPTAPAALSTEPDSTAERVRALVQAAVTPPSVTGLDPDTLKNAIKFETLAVIQAGVQELVTAVVEGDYYIHTSAQDREYAGRIQFAFIGHEDDQRELEQLLTDAAGKGIVKHSSSVVGSDGRINGRIMLFDLVERALENGTATERRAGEKLRREAQQVLAERRTTETSTNAAGETVYTVEAGDSLAYIALQFYGNTNDYARIYEANKTAIAQPDQIQVGQRLRIPGA